MWFLQLFCWVELECALKDLRLPSPALSQCSVRELGRAGRGLGGRAGLQIDLNWGPVISLQSLPFGRSKERERERAKKGLGWGWVGGSRWLHNDCIVRRDVKAYRYLVEQEEGTYYALRSLCTIPFLSSWERPEYCTCGGGGVGLDVASYIGILFCGD